MIFDFFKRFKKSKKYIIFLIKIAFFEISANFAFGGLCQSPIDSAITPVAGTKWVCTVLWTAILDVFRQPKVLQRKCMCRHNLCRRKKLCFGPRPFFNLFNNTKICKSQYDNKGDMMGVSSKGFWPHKSIAGS